MSLEIPLKEEIGGERRPKDMMKTSYFMDNSLSPMITLFISIAC
jgi:hypothetical protein